MTTTLDRGDAEPPEMLRCEITEASSLYPTLVLAVRDMRTANGRNETTGEGAGNQSLIGLSIAMTVLDTLTGDKGKVVVDRWRRLLTKHGVAKEDAEIIYAVRCSLLHGYGVPKPSKAHGRVVLLTDDHEAYALDTSRDGFARVSVPVFCGRLVERIATAAWPDWDMSLLDTDLRP